MCPVYCFYNENMVKNVFCYNTLNFVSEFRAKDLSYTYSVLKCVQCIVFLKRKYIFPRAILSKIASHQTPVYVTERFADSKDSGLYLYVRIRHSLTHLRPVVLSADWSISRLQSWTCSSLSTVTEFVKLTESIVIEIQRQSADLYKVQLCNRQYFVVSTAVYVVKVYECHPLADSLCPVAS